MAIPTNKQTFKELCLRRLGYPVTKQEITDDQCDDLIDYALSYYSDYHYNGKERVYLQHQITQENVDNGYIDLPDLVVGVIEVLDSSTTTNGSGIFSLQYQFAMSDMFRLRSTNLVPYVAAMQSLSMMSQLIGNGNMVPIRFNQHMNKLHLDTNWATISVGQYIIVECYRYLDPALYADIWKDRWLTDYTVQLFKRQIGEHLKKYNVPLIGGITVNGAELYNEATNELAKLEQDLFNNYSTPPRDFFG